MNSLEFVKEQLSIFIVQLFELDYDVFCKKITVEIQLNNGFGDLSTNAAMALAKTLSKKPMEIAAEIKSAMDKGIGEGSDNALLIHVSRIEIVAPGFVNITLKNDIWHQLSHELLLHPETCFKLSESAKRLNCLIEFVSANPTGPLSLGHGRNAIIGDTLARVLSFLGHNVKKEFYVNDAGNQIQKFGESIKARLSELCGIPTPLPEGGYNGQYVIDLAQEIFAENCTPESNSQPAIDKLLNQPVSFFKTLGKDKMLKIIKRDLIEYDVSFDSWFSEKSLHESGEIEKVITELDKRGFLYTQEDALWFKSTLFGDDKDRVIKKASGEYTYTAADIAYHKNKFMRDFDLIVNVLGQDHHSFAIRLMGIMQALEFDTSKLKIILYQLVRIKQGEVLVRMSKRLGTFHALSDVIKTIGVDAARYFYLNRKSDSHLELDLDVALKKDLSNPLYYLQYAWVRALRVLEKAREDNRLGDYAKSLSFNKEDVTNQANETEMFHIVEPDSVLLLKKICSLRGILNSVATTFSVHLLSVYADELAAAFHSFYNNNRILDCPDLGQARSRLVTVKLAKNTIGLTLDLMGLSKPESM